MVNKYIADDTWRGEVVCLSLAMQHWGPRGSHCYSAGTGGQEKPQFMLPELPVLANM